MPAMSPSADPAAEMTALLRRHRSIREFTDRAVEPALVREVCAQAIVGSSSSGNLNMFSIVCTRDAARRRELCRLHGDQPMIEQAPVLLTFCADSHRTRRWLARRGARLNFGNLISYHVCAFDAVIVAQSAALAFESHGLGICYLGTTLHAMREIAALLKLPDHCAPVTSMVVGWPAEAPEARDRLPIDALLHDETYRDPTDDELDRHFAEREVRGWERYRRMMPERFATFRAEGIANLAQFYTSEHKYAPQVFEQDSRELAAFLAERGFMP